MSVMWKGPGHKYQEAYLCVPCGGCNVEIGHECKIGWPCRKDRAAKAAAFGFVTVQPDATLDLFPATSGYPILRLRPIEGGR